MKKIYTKKTKYSIYYFKMWYQALIASQALA